MLVVRERLTRMTMACVMPGKSTGKFVEERVIAFMQEVGIAAMDVTVRSDQEPAMKALVAAVGRRKADAGGRWVVESSPVASHASNGVVERAIQSVQAQVRHEERVGREVGEENFGEARDRAVVGGVPVE